MYNALIWGLDEINTFPAVKKLHDENIINIKYWMGYKVQCPYCTHEINDVWYNRFDMLSFQGYDTKAYQYTHDYLLKFIDQYSRHFKFDQKAVQEYINIFNMYFDYYYNIITKMNINLVVLSDLPHDGVALVIYCITKYLGIKLIMVTPSVLDNRFFCVTDLKDVGTFSTSQVQKEIVTIHVENQFEKDIFYMKKQKRKHYLEFQRRLQQIKKTFNRDILDWMIYELQRYNHKRKYNANVKKHAVKNLDLNRPFVYFALHLQPEMTTSSIGGMYVDQLLAIERIRMAIPADWYIYVKENPKQTYFMRGQDFFKRLARIPNVIYVDKEIDTYRLLKHCKLVATITGTVGWEAITGGKSVLIFGDAWYKKFPGVFTYHDHIDIEQVVNFKPDFQEVQAALDNLSRKMGVGIVESGFAAALSDYTHEKNYERIFQFLKLRIMES